MSVQKIQTTEYINQNYFYWAFTPVKVSIYIRVYTRKWFGGLFGARPESFPPFKQVWSLSFLWNSLQYFWSVSTFCLIFLKWNSTLCQNYRNTGFTIIKICLFMAANSWKRRFQTFLDNMGMFIKNDNVWKHFKYWLSSSNLL